MKKPLLTITIKDCTVEYFTCSGNGGQHRNSTKSGVRITHEQSGAVGYSCDERKQHQNKVLAFRRMGESPKFQKWIRLKAAELTTKKTVEEIVEEMMQQKNLKVETQDSEGRWINQD